MELFSVCEYDSDPVLAAAVMVELRAAVADLEELHARLVAQPIAGAAVAWEVRHLARAGDTARAEAHNNVVSALQRMWRQGIIDGADIARTSSIGGLVVRTDTNALDVPSAFADDRSDPGSSANVAQDTVASTGSHDATAQATAGQPAQPSRILQSPARSPLAGGQQTPRRSPSSTGGANRSVAGGPIAGPAAVQAVALLSQYDSSVAMASRAGHAAPPTDSLAVEDAVPSRDTSTAAVADGQLAGAAAPPLTVQSTVNDAPAETMKSALPSPSVGLSSRRLRVPVSASPRSRLPVPATSLHAAAVAAAVPIARSGLDGASLAHAPPTASDGPEAAQPHAAPVGEQRRMAADARRADAETEKKRRAAEKAARISVAAQRRLQETAEHARAITERHDEAAARRDASLAAVRTHAHDQVVKAAEVVFIASELESVEASALRSAVNERHSRAAKNRGASLARIRQRTSERASHVIDTREAARRAAEVEAEEHRRAIAQRLAGGVERRTAHLRAVSATATAVASPHGSPAALAAAAVLASSAGWDISVRRGARRIVGMSYRNILGHGLGSEAGSGGLDRPSTAPQSSTPTRPRTTSIPLAAHTATVASRTPPRAPPVTHVDMTDAPPVAPAVKHSLPQHDEHNSRHGSLAACTTSSTDAAVIDPIGATGHTATSVQPTPPSLKSDSDGKDKMRQQSALPPSSLPSSSQLTEEQPRPPSPPTHDVHATPLNRARPAPIDVVVTSMAITEDPPHQDDETAVDVKVNSHDDTTDVEPLLRTADDDVKRVQAHVVRSGAETASAHAAQKTKKRRQRKLRAAALDVARRFAHASPDSGHHPLTGASRVMTRRIHAAATSFRRACMSSLAGESVHAVAAIGDDDSTVAAVVITAQVVMALEQLWRTTDGLVGELPHGSIVQHTQRLQQQNGARPEVLVAPYAGMHRGTTSLFATQTAAIQGPGDHPIMPISATQPATEYRCGLIDAEKDPLAQAVIAFEVNGRAPPIVSRTNLSNDVVIPRASSTPQLPDNCTADTSAVATAAASHNVMPPAPVSGPSFSLNAADAESLAGVSGQLRVTSPAAESGATPSTVDILMRFHSRSCAVDHPLVLAHAARVVALVATAPHARCAILGRGGAITLMNAFCVLCTQTATRMAASTLSGRHGSQVAHSDTVAASRIPPILRRRGRESSTMAGTAASATVRSESADVPSDATISALLSVCHCLWLVLRYGYDDAVIASTSAESALLQEQLGIALTYASACGFITAAAAVLTAVRLLPSSAAQLAHLPLLQALLVAISAVLEAPYCFVGRAANPAGIALTDWITMRGSGSATNGDSQSGSAPDARVQQDPSHPTPRHPLLNCLPQLIVEIAQSALLLDLCPLIISLACDGASIGRADLRADVQNAASSDAVATQAHILQQQRRHTSGGSTAASAVGGVIMPAGARFPSPPATRTRPLQLAPRAPPASPKRAEATLRRQQQQQRLPDGDVGHVPKKQHMTQHELEPEPLQQELHTSLDTSAVGERVVADGAPVRPPGSSFALGPSVVVTTTLALRVLCAVARLDLRAMQQSLLSNGGVGMTELMHAAEALLVCSGLAIAPTLRVKGSDDVQSRAAGAATPSQLRALLQELLVVLGYACFDCPAGQAAMCWGTHPLLRRLTAVPIAYFASPAGRDVLMPTLLAACESNATAMAILAAEVSPVFLQEWINDQLQQVDVDKTQSDVNNVVASTATQAGQIVVTSPFLRFPRARLTAALAAMLQD